MTGTLESPTPAVPDAPPSPATPPAKTPKAGKEKKSPAPAPPRPIGDIIQEFMSEIADHPDARLISGSRGLQPSRSESLSHVPLSLQRILTLKLVYRERQ